MPITQIIPRDYVPAFRAIHPLIDVIEENENKARIVTYTGRVIAVYEQNGAGDSDFFAIVWSHENKPLHVNYATTRAYTYDNSASVDASADIHAAYDAWVNHQARTARACGGLKARADRREERRKARISYAEQKRLRKLYSEKGETYKAIIKLLQTRRFRSSFRQSLAQCVRDWLADTSPSFRHPLTSRQMQYII
jgi:hypothetical protein